MKKFKPKQGVFRRILKIFVVILFILAIIFVYILIGYIVGLVLEMLRIIEPTDMREPFNTIERTMTGAWYFLLFVLSVGFIKSVFNYIFYGKI